MKRITRRGFFRALGVAVAGAAAVPLVGKALSNPTSADEALDEAMIAIEEMHVNDSCPIQRIHELSAEEEASLCLQSLYFDVTGRCL